MIWVIGDVEGRRYREPFSKGILARSLSITDIGSERAYEIASEIESKLIDGDINEITLTDLTNFIVDYLDYLDPDYAKKYLNWITYYKNNWKSQWKKNKVIILVS